MTLTLLGANSFVGYGPLSYVVIAVVAVVAAYVTLVRNNQTTLRQDNADLRAGRADDELEIERWKARYQESENERAREHGENGILRELNSNQSDFKELTTAIGGLKQVMDAILEVLLERKGQDNETK